MNKASAFVLIALLAALIYSNTFSAPFQFDDLPNIVENPRIKNLANFSDFSGRRYIGFLSFALNYHFGGPNVFGHHLVNLMIHITNGFLVYVLVLLLFRAAQTPPPTPHASRFTTAPGIALATALLFIAHPIQTQAVTYIVQRFASLATLFYLLTVVCYLKGRLSSTTPHSRLPTPHLWYGVALLSTVLAMKTKEISVTLPFLLVVIEWVFFRPVSKRPWLFLIPFLLTLPIIPLSRIDALGEVEAGFARETTEISRSSYLFTQFRVIVTYLRLLVLPVNQTLDYDYPIYHSFLDLPVFFSFLFLAALLGLALYLLFALRLTPHPLRLTVFGFLWFFLTLSVESSIIPIRDVIFEHRVYLPSPGFFMASVIAAVSGFEFLKTRRPGTFMARTVLIPLILALILTSLSIATFQRNRIWKYETSLWEDVVRKAPNKARGYQSLGLAYASTGRLGEAIQMYQRGLTLAPFNADLHSNLGLAYHETSRLQEAVQEYRLALQLKPELAEARNNLGMVYEDMNRWEEAISEYQIAIQLKPDLFQTHNNLGVLYENLGRIDEAIQEYQRAIQLKPDYAKAHYNLGAAYHALGQFEEAKKQYQEALQIKPDLEAARKALETFSLEDHLLQKR